MSKHPNTLEPCQRKLPAAKARSTTKSRKALSFKASSSSSSPLGCDSAPAGITTPSHADQAPSTFIGIDITKATFDVAFSKSGPVKQYPNTSEGISKLTKAIISSKPKLVVFESTGCYGEVLKAELVSHQVPFAMADAAQCRHFARAKGQKAKTDPIDAKMLASMGQALDLQPVTNHHLEVALLAQLVKRRQQLVHDRKIQRGYLESTVQSFKPDVQRIIDFFDQEVAGGTGSIR